MKRAPRSRQRHDLYAKYHDYDSEISDLLGECGINSKRADFLVVDREGWPVAVIEYQGSGHYQGNAQERDAVKRTVLPRAGIRYIEVAAPLSKRRLHLDAFLNEELRAAAP